MAATLPGVAAAETFDCDGSCTDVVVTGAMVVRCDGWCTFEDSELKASVEVREHARLAIISSVVKGNVNVYSGAWATLQGTRLNGNIECPPGAWSNGVAPPAGNVLKGNISDKCSIQYPY
ncbi:MAG: hypothetical protein R6W93_00115 [Candidatus Limnocylindrales bacterium]